MQQRPGGRLPLSTADIGEVDGLIAGGFARHAARRRAAAARPVERRRAGQASRFSAHLVVTSSVSQ